MTGRKKQEDSLIYYSSKIKTVHKAHQSSYCIIGFTDQGTKNEKNHTDFPVKTKWNPTQINSKTSTLTVYMISIWINEHVILNFPPYIQYMLTQLFYQIRLAVFYFLFSIEQKYLLWKDILWWCKKKQTMKHTHTHTQTNIPSRDPVEYVCVPMWVTKSSNSVVNLAFSFLSFAQREFP